MKRLKKPPRTQVLGFLTVLALSGCAGSKPPPSPMRDAEVRSTSRLRVGWYDFGSDMNPGDLRRCSQQFPNLEWQEGREFARALQRQGTSPRDLVGGPDQFLRFHRLQGFHLLLLTYRQAGKNYVRLINFLSQEVRTVLLDVTRPTCQDILAGQRLVVLDSYPPLADVFLDERLIGEAPLWTFLRDGDYTLTCRLPGQIFTPIRLQIPGSVFGVCQRENIDRTGGHRSSDDMELTGEEEAGSVLIYGVGAAAGLAGIILPILLLF